MNDSPAYLKDGKWVRLHKVDSFTEVEVPAQAPEPVAAPAKSDPAADAKPKGRK